MLGRGLIFGCQIRTGVGQSQRDGRILTDASGLRNAAAVMPRPKQIKDKAGDSELVKIL